VAITALTGGIAGPLVAAALGGFAAGAAGELIEAAVDKRPTSLGKVLGAGVAGALLGGALSGVGQFLARTGLGARIAEAVGRSAIGQAASRALYKIATSESGTAVAARAAAAGTRRAVTALQELGEGVGRRLGGPFARNAARQAEVREGLEAATNEARQAAGGRAAAAGREPGKADVAAAVQGEVNGERVSASTFPGQDRSGTGYRAIQTPSGPVQAPAEPPPPLSPIPVPDASGKVIPRGQDAEIKLFGHTLLKFGQNATGRLYLGVTAPMCPSCSLNLLTTRAAAPGLDIISRVPFPGEGAAGAFGPRDLDAPGSVPPPTPPLLELQLRFNGP
jgi:hypothetical protein